MGDIVVNVLLCISTIISIVLSVYTALKTIHINKSEYVLLKKRAQRINSNIRMINENSYLINNTGQRNSDEYKLVLYWDSQYIYASIKEMYPKSAVCIVIREYNNHELRTILKTGDNMFIDDSKQIIEENTDFNSIINEGYKYYFVTDLDFYSHINKDYKNDEAGRKYKYNTSIVFPIKSQDKDSKIVGLICVYVENTLYKKKDNDRIIKLLEKTNKSFSITLQNMQSSILNQHIQSSQLIQDGQQ